MAQDISKDLKDKLTVYRAIGTETNQVHLMISQGPNWYSLKNGDITLHLPITKNTF